MGGRGSSGGGSGGASTSSAPSRPAVEHLPGGAIRTTFSHEGGKWTAHASKEYGASKTVYVTATNPKGYQFKSSYSKTQEKFTNSGGAIDHAKAATHALGITEG